MECVKHISRWENTSNDGYWPLTTDYGGCFKEIFTFCGGSGGCWLLGSGGGVGGASGECTDLVGRGATMG